MLGMLLFGSVASAMRTRRPPTLTDLTDRNQLVELNNYLSEVYELTNGRYTLENLDIDPQDVRKGTKGDLVYATFSSIDHLCINTSFPAAKDWTCVNVETLSTCPGGDNQQVQYNDNGTCRGELAFIYNEDSNSVGIGEDVITPSATLEIDPADTTVSGEVVQFRSSSQTLTFASSGSTVANQRQNQFLAPTINGVSGGATETVTDAATVYINNEPTGSNITFTNPALALWVDDGDVRFDAHAAIGPDAGIDKDFSPDNYNNYFSGTFPHILTISDVRGNWGTAQVNGIEVELKSEPSGTEGFDEVILNGVTSRFVADGSAGTTADTENIVESLTTSSHFNALTQVQGTGADDEVDLITGQSLNSEFIINLSGTGTNTIGDIIWETVSDETRLTADDIDITLAAHSQLLDINTTSSTAITNSGFTAETDVSATGSTNNIIHAAFNSNLTITSADPTSNIAEHYEADSTYSSSASTGDNSIIDFGYTYFPAINGDTADVAVSIGFDSHQIISVEALDDGPGVPTPHSINLAEDGSGAESVPKWSMFGWHARQTIGLSNDSGTFDTMRVIDSKQRWDGDANGTTVDGLYIEGLTKLGTGTVTTATNVNLVAPSRSAGTLTNAYTLQFTVPSTAASENYGIYAANGTTSGIIVMEGGTADAFETSLGLVEPTADNIITFPNQTGTFVLLDSSSTVTVTGQVVVDSAAGIGQMTLDGATGGCLMFRDTDDAGFTECNALNGVLTCSIDADGVCD